MKTRDLTSEEVAAHIDQYPTNVRLVGVYLFATIMTHRGARQRRLLGKIPSDWIPEVEGLIRQVRAQVGKELAP